MHQLTCVGASISTLQYFNSLYKYGRPRYHLHMFPCKVRIKEEQGGFNSIKCLPN